MPTTDKHRSNDRIERILDYAETTVASEAVTEEQQQRRREFGRGFITALDDVHRMMRGEIPFPKRDRTWLKKLQQEATAGDFDYEND